MPLPEGASFFRLPPDGGVHPRTRSPQKACFGPGGALVTGELLSIKDGYERQARFWIFDFGFEPAVLNRRPFNPKSAIQNPKSKSRSSA
jgi:hypothetical protein